MAEGAPSTFGALAQTIVHAAQMSINTSLPAEVRKWTAPVAGKLPATVECVPTVSYARKLAVGAEAQPGETVKQHPSWGRYAVGQYKPIPNVPVLYLGAPGMRARGPLPVGTQGILLFAARGLDQWKQVGKGDPDHDGAGTLADAFFLPGLVWGSVGLSVDEEDWALANDAGTAMVAFQGDVVAVEGASVKLRGGGRQVVGHGDKVSVDDLWATWLAAVGAGSGAGPPPGYNPAGFEIGTVAAANPAPEVEIP